jgi:hypothetical protein
MKKVGDMEPRDISKEKWREYDFGKRIYRIDSPKILFIGKTTHRVVDANGTVHCVPAPGTGDCVLRWKNTNPRKPVNF